MAQVTPIEDMRGRKLFEVMRWKGERRPPIVKGLRRLWAEPMVLSGQVRELYLRG